MTEYIYRCRKCAAVFAAGVCPAEVPCEVVKAQLSTIPAFQHIPGSIAYTVHECGDGGAGLADWIGCQPESKS
jgi:hypothetical protein